MDAAQAGLHQQLQQPQQREQPEARGQPRTAGARGADGRRGSHVCSSITSCFRSALALPGLQGAAAGRPGSGVGVAAAAAGAHLLDGAAGKGASPGAGARFSPKRWGHPSPQRGSLRRLSGQQTRVPLPPGGASRGTRAGGAGLSPAAPRPPGHQAPGLPWGPWLVYYCSYYCLL